MSAFLGLDILLLVAIVGLTEKVKEVVPLTGGWKKLYMVVPLVLSVGLSFALVSEVNWSSMSLSVVKYWGVSVLFYDSVIQYIRDKRKELKG